MYLKVLIVSFVVLLLGALVGFLAFPLAFNELIRRSVNLKPGSETRQLWQRLPFPLSFRIYVFNVTNAQDIEKGGKPRLEQVGPFVYDEWKDKYDVVDNEAENTVSFNMRNTFHFCPDLGLDGEQLITMPHPLLQFMAIASLGQPAEAQAGLASGLASLFQPKSAFITAKFKDLFYDGFPIDCTTEQPAAQAICQQLEAGAVPGAVPFNSSHYKFSLLGASNHTNGGRFKVTRSSTRKSLVGQLLSFNGAEELQVWQQMNSSKCNRLRGTDGTIFAPLMRPEQGLWSYSAQLCRSLTPIWMGSTQYQKLPAQRYQLSLGSPSTEPELHCFCTDYPVDCPASGTMDLLRCTGTPLIASLPHFYGADPKLLEEVEGLKPTAAQHASTLIFEQLSGTVLAVHNRLQFSLRVLPVKDIPTMSQLRPLAMPLFWIEESLQLDERVTQRLKKKIFAVLKANDWFKWLSIGLGSLGLILSALFLHLTRSDVKRVGASVET